MVFGGIMNAVQFVALLSLLSNVPALFLLGFSFARWQASKRALRKVLDGERRVDAILAKMREQGGWLDFPDFQELVTIWPGFAPLAFQVRRPWDPPPTRKRDEGRAN
jgi:hypothetical protein